MTTCSADDVRRYRELLLEIGVPIELKAAWVQPLCNCLTDDRNKNPAVAQNDDMRNLAAQGFFTSGKTHLFVVPPDRSLFSKLSWAIFAEGMRARSDSRRETFGEILMDLHKAFSKRFGGNRHWDDPEWSNQRIALLYGSERVIHFPLDYLYAEIEGEGKGKAVAARVTDFDGPQPPSVRVFDFEGRTFYTSGLTYGRTHGGKHYATSVNVNELVPKSEWKKKTFSRSELLAKWNENEARRGDQTGFLVKVNGKLHVVSRSLYAVPDFPELQWEAKS